MDKRVVRRDFAQAADTYDRHADLQRQVAGRVAGLFVEYGGGETVLDAGSGTGLVGRALAARSALPERLIALDLAHAMTRRGARAAHPSVTGDCERLPFAPATLDAAISSLTLQWVNDLPATLAGLARCLRPGGTLVASTLAAGTLNELEGALVRADGRGGVGPFHNRHQLAAALASSGLSRPHCWEETVVKEASRPAEVLRTLKGLGAVSKDPRRSRGLHGRRRIQHLEAAYRAACRAPRGPVPVTWRVAFLVARKPPR